MILLDTNVLSELMRPSPAARVLVWLDRQAEVEVWVSAITRAEIALGLALLPDGKRKTALAEAAEQMFREDFSGRCLPFDEEAADHYADIVARRTRLGRPIGVEDAQIAAIARVNQLSLATRNLEDFTGIDGLAVVDPWRAEAASGDDDAKPR